MSDLKCPLCNKGFFEWIITTDKAGIYQCSWCKCELHTRPSGQRPNRVGIE